MEVTKFSNNWNTEIPKELLQHIFSYLKYSDVLVVASLVCKRWHSIGRQDHRVKLKIRFMKSVKSTSRNGNEQTNQIAWVLRTLFIPVSSLTVFITFILFIAGIVSYTDRKQQIDLFRKANCFVNDSSLVPVNCGPGIFSCYESRWNATLTSKDISLPVAIIKTGLNLALASTYLNFYKINETHPCYYNHESEFSDVRWEAPNTSTSLYLLLTGLVMFVLWSVLTIIAVRCGCYKSRINPNGDKSIC